MIYCDERRFKVRLDLTCDLMITRVKKMEKTENFINNTAKLPKISGEKLKYVLKSANMFQL